jgi:hypothetical protein
MPHLGTGDFNGFDLFNGWGVEGWLTCHILLREANDLILPHKPTTRQGTAALLREPLSEPSSR